MRRDKALFHDNYGPEGCKLCASNPKNYNFFVRNCKKQQGRNVTTKVQEIVEGSQAQALALTNGDWVLCWSGTDDGEKVWLGRCVNNDSDPRFKKGVAWKNDTGKIRKKVGVGEITLARDEIGVTVQWYDRCKTQLDPGRCVQYKICDATPPCVQSGTSIISSKLQLTQMAGVQATTAYTRRQHDIVAATQFVKVGWKRNPYMTTSNEATKRQMKETWELDLATHNNGVNAVDWFMSR
jgi:hypothetical protein